MNDGINVNQPAAANVRPPIAPKAPPQPPAKRVVREHCCDFKHLSKLELRDGDVLSIHADAGYECVQEFLDLLHEMHHGKRLLIVLGDVQALDEAAMNAAGWYRK